MLFNKSTALLFLTALSPFTTAQYNYGGSSSTTTTASASSPSAAASGTIDVQVGNSGLTFNPSTVTAPVGSIVNFHFFPPSHSVAESDFGSPCQFKSGGIWSGFMPTSSGAAVCTANAPGSGRDGFYTDSGY
jgi:plastocyanin